MSLLELGGKYREMYTGFENIEVPCMVILMLSRNRFFTENEYITMHGLLVTLKNLFVRTEHDYSLRSQI